MKLTHVLLVLSLAVVAGGLNASESTLVYRTDSLMVSAVAYDTETDSPVELVRLGEDGPSVLRRVSKTGRPGTEFWRTDGDTFCPGCGLGLEYSQKLGGYVVLAAVGRSRYQKARVYLVRGQGDQRLLARVVVQPTRDYPEEDKLEAGVVGFREIHSVMVAAGGYHVLVNGLRNGLREVKTYALDVAKSQVTESLEGRVLGVGPQGYFVSADTKEWKTARGETEPNREALLARTPLIAIPDNGVQRVVQAGDQRAEWRTNGELFIYKAGKAAGASARKGAAESAERAVEFKCCAIDGSTVTGVWATKRGTFMVAVDCTFRREEGDRLFGLAHCLYEIE